jgi:hypothetical protein
MQVEVRTGKGLAERREVIELPDLPVVGAYVVYRGYPHLVTDVSYGNIDDIPRVGLHGGL